MKNKKNILTNLLFLLFIFYIFILNLINCKKIDFFLILLIGLIFLLIIKKISKNNNFTLIKKISIILLITYFIFLLYLGFNTIVEYNWDYGQIQISSIYFAEKNEFFRLKYYAIYPNNQLILIFLSIIFKFVFIISGTHSRMFYHSLSIVLNCIIICYSIYLYYKLINKKMNEKLGLIFIIFIILCLPLSSYASLFYTDTLVMPLVPLILLNYFNYKESKNKNYLYLLSLLSVIGYLIKPTIIFVSISVFIDMFKNIKIKYFVYDCFFALFIFLLFLNISNYSFNKILGITDEMYYKYQFPHTHHIMMALNTTGGYDDFDFVMTSLQKNYNLKKEFNKKVIIYRIKEYGFKGIVKHLFYTKIKKTWVDSKFFSYFYLDWDPINKGFWYSLLTTEGKYYKYYDIYSNAYWIFILFGLILTVIRKNNIDINNIFKNTIIFLIIFLMIWECNSRYVLQILPLIILLSLNGYYDLINNKLNNMSKYVNKIKLSLK